MPWARATSRSTCPERVLDPRRPGPGREPRGLLVGDTSATPRGRPGTRLLVARLLTVDGQLLGSLRAMAGKPSAPAQPEAPKGGRRADKLISVPGSPGGDDHAPQHLVSLLVPCGDGRARWGGPSVYAGLADQRLPCAGQGPTYLRRFERCSCRSSAAHRPTCSRQPAGRRGALQEGLPRRSPSPSTGSCCWSRATTPATPSVYSLRSGGAMSWTARCPSRVHTHAAAPRRRRSSAQHRPASRPTWAGLLAGRAGRRRRRRLLRKRARREGPHRIISCLRPSRRSSTRSARCAGTGHAGAQAFIRKVTGRASLPPEGLRLRPAAPRLTCRAGPSPLCWLCTGITLAFLAIPIVALFTQVPLRGPGPARPAGGP
jgi:hypothetical protein